MTERRAIAVVDLGFGDAGKGVVTDALVRRLGAHAVVRFNGGAQAGHNVTTPDGRHHTFAQFGAGTFVEGVRTYSSRHVVVHPPALLAENEHLRSVGVPDALDRLSISAEAKVITPFHQAACRVRELARGAARHGSVGVGVGETVRDGLSAIEPVVMRHLHDPTTLKRLLRETRERLRVELESDLKSLADHPEAALFHDESSIDPWIAQASSIPRSVVVDDDVLVRQMRGAGTVIFEGAQGVLLDEWRGFHPYTTWSTCTFDNVRELLGDEPFERLGVLRTYATRHGVGPFPTEAKLDFGNFGERYNDDGPWQGAFRTGHLDLVLLRYAIEVAGGIDGIAVTHLDTLARMKEFRVCTRYEGRDRLQPGPFRDLDHQSKLTEALFAVEPVYSTPPRRISFFEDALSAPLRLGASGPTARDARWFERNARAS